MKTNNLARDQGRRVGAIRKKVQESWSKSKNPNMFGGCPVVDNSGKIISLEIASFGFLAEFFESEEVQKGLLEACRRNNLEFNGHEEEDLADGIKDRVDAFPPEPEVPIFLLKSYPLQSYFSQLIRFINKISGDEMPGGSTWGLGNKDAPLPSGWRNDLLDFALYGGPGTGYTGGRLPPRIKDLIVHYFYLLGLNPNEHARTIPENYEERDLDKLSFIPPPPDFVVPHWATPKDPNEEDSDMTSLFVSSKVCRKTLMPSSSPPASSSPPRESSSPPRESSSPPRELSSPPGVSSSPPRVLSTPVSPPSPLRVLSTPASPPSPPRLAASPSPSTVPRRSPRIAASSSPCTPPAVSPALRPRRPPPPPAKRLRSPSPVIGTPTASSTLRIEEDDGSFARPKIILHIRNAQLASKAPKKKARLSNSLGKLCFHCDELVSILDLKAKNGLVCCSDHKVHYYCQEACLKTH